MCDNMDYDWGALASQREYEEKDEYIPPKKRKSVCKKCGYEFCIKNKNGKYECPYCDKTDLFKW